MTVHEHAHGKGGSTRTSSKHLHAFWLVAASFAAVMSFTTLPTPMYPLYQQKDGFSTVMITVIFAAYGLGVMGGLYFAGHVSDYLGRRRVLAAAISVEVLACVLFLASTDVPALLIARFICGLGIGALTSTATASLSELRSVATPDEDGSRASLVAGAVNTGGLALGPLLGGVLVEWSPDPLFVPFLTLLVVLVLAGAALAFVPETVRRPQRRPAYRPQRVSVEPQARAEFAAAALAAGAAFAVLGFYTALTGTVLATVMDRHSAILTGTVTFLAMGCSSVSQLLLFRLSTRTKVRAGRILMVLGLALIAGGTALPNLVLFIVGGAVAGAGIGLVFSASIAAANRMADPSRRSETVAGIFLAAYAGITGPVVLCGVLLIWLPTVELAVGFAAVIAVTVLLATARMLRPAGDEPQ